ncbi:phosphate acyltransferase PlsX [Bacillota bacterium LX-D]|nr:phosphate acyltransferase PlsX [Bacillota bacterium LX-D]
MRLAIDAMGGDHAPQQIVEGAVKAAKEKPSLEIILVGQEAVLKKELQQHTTLNNISICPANEVITMEEEPALAVRSKKDASIVVATKLVKDKEADAIISAGSTGAQMASALLGLGRIKGIARPAIATVFPTLKGGKLVLDVGANSDCKPIHLVQFAHMGSIYAEKLLQISNPKVGLLNIGSEEKKGNELTQETYHLLKREQNLNFIGNIEPRYIPLGEADVIVCDGFVGNAILKFAEGLSSFLFKLIKQELTKNFTRRIGAALVKSGFKDIKNSLDYTEYGGAPLLGVNGVSIICHGSSNAYTIKNGIFAAARCVESDFVRKISEVIALEEQKG